MFVIRYRKILYAIIGGISALSIAAVIFYGLTLSIEFTGGVIIEPHYPNGLPAQSDIENELNKLSIGEYSLRKTGTDGYLLRTKNLSQEEVTEVKQALALNGTVPTTIERSATVGPVIGNELKNKAGVAIVLVILIIILYITFVFRKVSKPVSSWMYGVIAVLVLLHDLIIPIGLFAALGHFMGAEVDVLFVMAVLTILGYSVNDTIVVFDRVRENLRINLEKNTEEPFDELVGRSLVQTIARSLNTSITTFLGVMALFLFGGSTTHYFALTLGTGIIAGTYSSILLASPLLVTIERWQAKKQARTQ